MASVRHSHYTRISGVASIQHSHNTRISAGASIRLSLIALFPMGGLCGCTTPSPHGLCPIPTNEPVSPTLRTSTVALGPQTMLRNPNIGQAPQSPNTSNRHRHTDNVINLSSRRLSPEERALLNLRLSFVPSPHPKKFSDTQLSSDFSTLCEGYMANYTVGIPESSKRRLNSICNKIKSDLDATRVRCQQSYLSTRFRQILRDLKNDNDIVISKRIKGMRWCCWTLITTPAWPGTIYKTGRPTHS